MTAYLPLGGINRPRILVSGGLSVGGPQTHLTILCEVLLRAGAEVTVAAAATNWTSKAIADLRSQGVHVVVSPFGFGALQGFAKLWALIAWPLLLRRRYDVLCCIGEGNMHRWASRFVVPTGWKIYHEIVECPARGSVGERVAARMDAVVANSGKVADRMSGLLPGLPVRVIPFLTARALMRPPAPREAIGGRVLRMAFLGRLVPHKRPDRLIQAWPAWNDRAPISPARLDIYGGDYDNEASRLRARIKERGLQDSVCLRGAYATSDLPKIFSETDLVVLPSCYEGLPLVLVEAMQAGVPVVATSAGGTEELGDDNPDVIISPGTDWESFEAAVQTMAGRIRMGEIDGRRLHEWTEARYGFEPVAEAWRKALLKPAHFFSPQSHSFANTQPAQLEAK